MRVCFPKVTGGTCQNEQTSADRQKANMDGDKKDPPDAQFISFQDYSPIHRSGGTGQAQLDIGTSGHQPFGNLSNDPTGIGMVEDLQGMPNTTG